MDMTLQIKSPTYRQIYKGITHRRGPAMTIAANQRGSRLLEESSTKIGVEKNIPTGISAMTPFEGV